MGTTGARNLQRSSLSSKRAQRTIKQIETVIGRRISSHTSDNSAGQKTPGGQGLVAYNGTRLDKADRR